MDKKILGVFVLLTVTALACGMGDILPGGEEEGPPPPTPVPVDVILFQDDLNDSNSGWEVGEYDGGDVGYKDGVYFVTSTTRDTMMWGVAGRSFDNVVVAVDVTQISAGPTSNNAYGVVCREQDGGGMGYYLRISGDGHYSIVKAANEAFTPLVDWTESSAIKQGNATNHIQAACSGTSIELFVNGERVGGVEDSTFATGDIAFTATTYEDEITEIHFDNVVVYSP